MFQPKSRRNILSNNKKKKCLGLFKGFGFLSFFLREKPRHLVIIIYNLCIKLFPLNPGNAISKKLIWINLTIGLTVYLSSYTV